MFTFRLSTHNNLRLSGNAARNTNKQPKVCYSERVKLIRFGTNFNDSLYLFSE